VIVRFIDIGVIVDHHCLNFRLIIILLPIPYLILILYVMCTYFMRIVSRTKGQNGIRSSN